MEKKCRNRECPLRSRSKIEVPYTGNLDAEIAVIGESPGQVEEQVGQPFMGRAGKLGKKIVAEEGLQWHNLFIMNSARCKIDKKEMPTKAITTTLRCCRRRVEIALHSLRGGHGPECIVLFGDYAMRQILRKSGIRKARGRWIWSSEFDCWVMPTLHPAYVLRNPGEREFLAHDLRLVAAFAKRGFKHEEQDETVEYKEAADLKEVIEEGSYVSVDTEAQGLDWTSRNFVLLSVSVSDGPGRAYQVNLYEECRPAKADFTIWWPRAVEGSRKLLDVEVGVKKCPRFGAKVKGLRWFLANEKIKKVMMHGNFDLHGLDRFFKDQALSWKMAGYVMDIQAAANVLDENLHKLSSLEDLQGFFTNYTEDYSRKFDQEYDKSDMLAVPAEARLRYACADADVTRRAAVTIRGQMLQNRKLARYYVQQVHPSLFWTLRALERNGAWIDPKMLPKTTNEVLELWKTETKGAVACAPRAVKDIHAKRYLKLSRDEFVRDVLFSEKGFRISPVKRTAGGVPSIDKETRRILLERGIPEKARKFLGYYNEWSELYTLWSRYLRGFERSIRVDGRIHSSMSLATTVTGRVASRNPNMQNNPKRSKSAAKIRQLIAAPLGWLLISADQEQSELRWAAHVANAQSMIQIFKNGADIHTNTARSMVRWDSISEQERKKARQNAKPVNFGMLYLMSASGLSRYAKMEYETDMTEEEAARYIEIWFRTYPELREYHRRTIDFCRRHGYVESPLGRRRRLPEITADDRWIRHEAERQAVNHPIQGPSSDVVLMCCNELLRKELLDPADIFPVLFVHDELVFQVRDTSKVADYAKMIQHEMENPPLKRDFGLTLRVPLASEIKVGPNLARMETLN